MAAIVWVNGRIVEANEPAIAVTDRGFLYGEGLFETMRAYEDRVFRLAQHLERLNTSAIELGLPIPSREDITAAVSEALRASELSDASVRLTLTPGPAGATAPTLVVLVRPLTLPPPERYRAGCTAVTVPTAITRETPLRQIKSLNYLDKILAQRRAEHAGAHEAILIDRDEYIIEGAMRNVFAVIGGVLVTPPLSRGLLPGITRAAVLECAQQLHLPSKERDLPLEELLQAEECFLTSSLAEILPVASVNGTPFTVVPGPLTSALTTAYRALVISELT